MMKTALLLVAVVICCDITKQTLIQRSFIEVVTMIVFDNQDISVPLSCEKRGRSSQNHVVHYFPFLHPSLKTFFEVALCSLGNRHR